MPPKSKLQKHSAPKANMCPSSPPTQSSSEQSLSSEGAQRLEAEICWCIQQLQLALKSGKLTPKQLQEHTKAVNALMNNSTPLVKKRQVMRLSFGDYRAKMATEEKRTSSVNTKIRVAPASPSKNSVFLRKSLLTSSGGDFRFNFKQPVTNESEDHSGDKSGECTGSTFCFSPSDNSFKFNFTAD